MRRAALARADDAAALRRGAARRRAARVARAVPVLRGVETTIVKHVHSAGSEPDGSGTSGYHVPVTPPPSTTQLEHPATPQDMAHLVEHAPDAEAGTVLYRFRVGGFSLLWHDSAGPLAEDAPETFDVFRALRPIDVQVGAIQGFNQITNGMRDPRLYIEAFAPALFVPAHHDDWAAGITTKGENYRQPLADELERIPPESRPQVRFIADPADYVKPEVLTFGLRLDPPRLVRTCSGHRLRAALAGDLADVAAVTFRRGRFTRRDDSAPFMHTFPRRARAGRVVALATDVDGTTARLARRAPRCG